MARRTSTQYTGSNFRRPGWMVFVTVGISLLNALVRVYRLFAQWRKTHPSAPPPPPAADTSAPRVSTPVTRSVPPVRGPGRGVVASATPSPAGSDGGIPDLFRQQRTDVAVTASGLVVKLLPDDTDTSDGSEQHQKFLVELVDRARTTIKICHNLKFGRVPVKEGDVVNFHGEYEYSALGGTVHWTHHDPMQIHEDGWIEIDGQRYG